VEFRSRELRRRFIGNGRKDKGNNKAANKGKKVEVGRMKAR